MTIEELKELNRILHNAILFDDLTEEMILIVHKGMKMIDRMIKVNEAIIKNKIPISHEITEFFEKTPLEVQDEWLKENK